jgi:hypothetical protein
MGDSSSGWLVAGVSLVNLLFSALGLSSRDPYNGSRPVSFAAPPLQRLLHSTSFAAPTTLAQHVSRNTYPATRRLLHLFR